MYHHHHDEKKDGDDRNVVRRLWEQNPESPNAAFVMEQQAAKCEPQSAASAASSSSSSSASQTSTAPPAPNNNNKKKSTSTSTSTSTALPLPLRAARTMVDVLLATVFTAFLLVSIIRIVHHDYYRPLFDRATRTDHDLLDEYTYYERQCNDYDLTTHDIRDLFVDTTTNTTTTTGTTTTTTTALDQMMTHGALVIPHVLDLHTVRELRAYIVRRNAAVTDQEAYPVSQGEHRLSYGIDATEDVAVARAIQQVALHPVVAPLLQGLLGDSDPASAEITAITAYYGSPEQIWHSDTKADGNALKYARTYSHSYSLFLPLQDTTADMGPTDICPGTHYCANDLSDLCQRNRMGLHLATPAGVFQAGDGALLNQHVWHRGSAHTDPHAPERIVFILSFLARPKLGMDPRQLSRGTYFHQKWNMWGHTWRDLQDPMRSMTWPFSLLRCLHLWKPAAPYHWGYDLVTSGFMRFANEQLEQEDLSEKLMRRLDQLGFPLALRGQVLMDDASQKESWQVFLQETVDKTYDFFKKINIWLHGGYAVLLLITALFLRIRGGTSGISSSSSMRLLRGATIRMVMTHTILLALTYWVLVQTRESEWGSNILSGRTLMRPFPPVAIVREEEERLFVSSGPTTFPQRHDVLIGTRFASPLLGAYDRWLDYHPGNVVWRTISEERASRYRDYRHLDGMLFSERLEQEVLELLAATEGRLLHQDYRSGDWRIMTQVESRRAVQEQLLTCASPFLSSLRKNIDWMVANYRFGTIRRTGLARVSQIYLTQLWNRIFASVAPARPNTKTKTESTMRASAPHGTFPRRQTIHSSPVSAAASGPKFATRRHGLPSKTTTRMEQEEDDDTLQVGSSVWVLYDDWFPGTILAVHDDGQRVDIAFDDGEVDMRLEREVVHKKKPVTENDVVMGCFQPGLEDCFEGTVSRVSPSGRVMIQYDDGDVSWSMHPARYYVPPFQYAWF